jgi:hypothetical protein
MWRRLVIPLVCVVAVLDVALAAVYVTSATEPDTSPYVPPTVVPFPAEAWPPSVEEIGGMALSFGYVRNFMGDASQLVGARLLTVRELTEHHGPVLHLPADAVVGLAELDLWYRHALGWGPRPPTDQWPEPGDRVLVVVYRDPPTGHVMGRMAAVPNAFGTHPPATPVVSLDWGDPSIVPAQ